MDSSLFNFVILSPPFDNENCNAKYLRHGDHYGHGIVVNSFTSFIWFRLTAYYARHF